MRPILSGIILGGLFLAGWAASAIADPTPRLWGTSYAIVSGPGDPVLGRQARSVRVSVRLPANLRCLQVLSVARGIVDERAMQRDPLTAAPVAVTVAPAPCRGDWRDGWARFVVQGPTGSDILDVAMVTPDGRRLGHERIAIETSATTAR